jgi:hypothetical protein
VPMDVQYSTVLYVSLVLGEGEAGGWRMEGEWDAVARR